MRHQVTMMIAGLVLTVLAVGQLQATPITITATGGTSGGNPGGQTLYEVSGLMQGDAFNVNWFHTNALVADGMVFIDKLTATEADIRVMINNLSPVISGVNPRITSFGISISGFASLDGTSSGGTYLDDQFDSGFPGFMMISACGSSGTNCSGGGSGGIPAGSSDHFTIKANGNFGASLTLDEFALKFQGGPPNPNQNNEDS